MRHTFTAEEANALLPRVRTGLEQARETLARLRDVRDQLTDLRIVYGADVERPDCEAYDEYVAFRDEFALLENQLRAQMAALHSIGCEVKDPDAGLVDFLTEREGRPAYLCWQRGEDQVSYWHTLEGGFAARRPLK